MTSTNKKVSIIIPAYNEEKTIASVIKSIQSFASEVIVVNDGSSDETAKAAEIAGALVVTNKPNEGYEASIEEGFKRAYEGGADIFVTCDADGQHRSLDVKKVIDRILEGDADIVIGQRGSISHFAEKIFAIYTRFSLGIKDPLCGLKAYKREVYEAVGHFDTFKSIGTQLMAEGIKKGFTCKTVDIVVADRVDQSRFYFNLIKANWKIFKAMVKLIVTLS